MEFMVLDKNYDGITMIDTFTSAIWTVRYDEAGDFEIYTPVRLDYIQAMQIGNYLWNRDSDRLMVIETVEIETDAEEGPQLIVTGRSLESILDRRIVTSSQNFSGNLQSVLFAIIQNEVISSGGTRRIPGFSLKTSSDSRITSISISELSIRGENVYDVVCSLCQANKVGWRILPKGAGGFEFELYVGVDRSYAQSVNPYVTFSPSFENLLNSNYIKSFKSYKNSIYAVGTYQKEVILQNKYKDDNGEWVVEEQTTYEEAEVVTWQYSETATPSGLARREMFIDNGGVNDGEQGGEYATWNAVNKEKAIAELGEHQTTTAFEGELEATRQYIYREDFNIGDIVQVENEFGITGTVYISEIVFSQDANGITITPTFTSTEDETIG
jgi:hypothetical protein|nr:MAG TPA: hypothetical protein [Caudoviricetes sp.]